MIHRQLPPNKEIYTDEWKKKLEKHWQKHENFWAFNYKRAWEKHKRGVRQELDLAHLISNWLDFNGARVLVLGSYLGTEAIAYALCNSKVTSIDLDNDVLELSRMLARRHGVDINTLCIDATNTPFEDNAFDYVSCSQVIEHLPPKNQPDLLKEIWRVTKPGGLIWIDTPNQHSYKDRHDTGLPFIHWLPRRVKTRIARSLRRAVVNPEPSFNGKVVELHYYLSYFGLCRLLGQLGNYKVLSRYRGYENVNHYASERIRQGRGRGFTFAIKTMLLRAVLVVWNWNWFTDMRLVIRKETD